MKVAHPDSRRDWTYVDDTVRAFMLAGGTHDIEGEIINVGNGKTVTVKGMANTVIDMMGIDTTVVIDPSRERPSNSEVKYLSANADKSKKLLCWEPVITLERGVAQTIQWFRENRHIYYRPGQYTF
jgi:nucleoside-diphosphate-sugar epimerase